MLQSLRQTSLLAGHLQSGLLERLLCHCCSLHTGAGDGGAAAAEAAGGEASTSSSSSSSSFSAAGQQQLPQPDLVDKLLSLANMSRRQRLEQRKLDIIREFQRTEGDVGSPEVQIALLTEKIRDLSQHFVVHKKDFHSMRGLTGMLNQRRKLLSYLRRSNFERYGLVLHRLGLKDTYAKQARYDKFRVGTRLGTPAEPLKRYGNK